MNTLEVLHRSAGTNRRGLDVGVHLGHVNRHGVGEGVEGTAGGAAADLDAVVGGRSRSDTQSDKRNSQQSDHEMFLHSTFSFLGLWSISFLTLFTYLSVVIEGVNS